MHVLWPSDGSPGARRVLPALARLCHRPDDLLTVVTVDEPPTLDVARRLLGNREAATDGTTLLASQLALVARLPGRVEGVTVSGLAGPRVVAVAADVRPDLVVMGSHAQRSAHRLLLGSTSALVARQAPCSVLVLRQQALPRRILVAHDGSADARAALRTLRALGPIPGAEVTLIRVVAEGPPTEAFPSHARRFAPGIGRVARARAREASDALAVEAREYHQAGFTNTRTAVLRGDPWLRLREQIRRLRPDLVAVGATGQRSIRMMPGSIPERTLREAPSAVLISRAVPHAHAVELQ
ncbi:MAG: hypothetical protein AMXMBFR23_25450 [Chloroflexota bacterium]